MTARSTATMLLLAAAACVSQPSSGPQKSRSAAPDTEISGSSARRAAPSGARDPAGGAVMPSTPPANSEPAAAAGTAADAPALIVIAPLPPPTDAELDAIAERLFVEVNAARRRAGAPRLRADPRLMRAAKRYSLELARRREIEHVSATPGRRTFRDRIAAEGAKARIAGENLARIGTTAERLPGRAVGAWMRSPGHRRNMLDPVFRRTGVGVMRGEDNIWYVTQVYATRS